MLEVTSKEGGQHPPRRSALGPRTDRADDRDPKDAGLGVDPRLTRLEDHRAAENEKFQTSGESARRSTLVACICSVATLGDLARATATSPRRTSLREQPRPRRGGGAMISPKKAGRTTKMVGTKRVAPLRQLPGAVMDKASRVPGAPRRGRGVDARARHRCDDRRHAEAGLSDRECRADRAVLADRPARRHGGARRASRRVRRPDCLRGGETIGSAPSSSRSATSSPQTPAGWSSTCAARPPGLRAGPARHHPVRRHGRRRRRRSSRSGAPSEDQTDGVIEVTTIALDSRATSSSRRGTAIPRRRAPRRATRRRPRRRGFAESRSANRRRGRRPDRSRRRRRAG
jgi:hypothetical protein